MCITCDIPKRFVLAVEKMNRFPFKNRETKNNKEAITHYLIIQSSHKFAWNNFLILHVILFIHMYNYIYSFVFILYPFYSENLLINKDERALFLHNY